MPARTASRNQLNIQQVGKSFGRQPILDEVSLGVSEGERIGVVGRNGGGKSTLLKVLAGQEPIDSGRVTRANSLRMGLLSQGGDVEQSMNVGEYVVGDQAEHLWASDARAREVLTALIGGYGQQSLKRSVATLSGGEHRRMQLAKLLIQDLDLLLLDEPTNHLDVEAVSWLAAHLKGRGRLSVVVVTHDRWFLDEVSDRMWETIDGRVEEYEGGYSAYVLAKAERQRQASAEQARRNNLIRKELAWLRRGPPARTSKPKFRIDAANQLIADEPPARSQVELLAFAGARLGKTVFETNDVSLTLGERQLFGHLTWGVGPGDRIGVIGANGAGKTSLMRLMLGLQSPSTGRVKRGATVKPAYLSQHLEELDPKWRVLEAVEHVAQRVELGKGRELTATQLCERLGFVGDAQWTPVAELSGGERRRLQLSRLLMAGPNVLILDEPTNDFDIETLTALEDLLDSFGGTILVISHDRYFLERVCDRFVGLLGDGGVRDLPSGVDEFLALRRQVDAESTGNSSTSPQTAPKSGGVSAADERSRRKSIAKLERQLDKLAAEEVALHSAMRANAADHAKVTDLHHRLSILIDQRRDLEEAWLLAVE
ncbi:MAG: ABC-F family ATP-binding cassette domain-containing protein [Candidatus Nanopelagicales bacterium]